jgi:hypothetical protein
MELLLVMLLLLAYPAIELATFVLMQATGRLDWSKVLSRPRNAPPPRPRTSQPEVPAQT